MSRCEACPIAEGACRAQVDPRYGHLCGLAAEGRPSALAMIRNLSGGEAPAPSYPSLGRTLVGAAKAAVRVVLSGGERVDRAEFDRRHAVCERCPSGKFDAERDRCRACSCFMSVKPWLKALHCPLEHW